MYNTNSSNQPNLTFSSVIYTFTAMKKILILLLIAVSYACQPPVNHSPQPSQDGKSSFSDPGVSILHHDFFKHYADLHTTNGVKLNLISHADDMQYGNNQIFFGYADGAKCDIICIMLSIATACREKQNNIWRSSLLSQTGKGVCDCAQLHNPSRQALSLATHNDL